MTNKELKEHIYQMMLNTAKKELLDLVYQGEDVDASEGAIIDFAYDMFSDMSVTDLLVMLESWDD